MQPLFMRYGSPMLCGILGTSLACGSKDPAGISEQANAAPVIEAIALTADHDVAYNFLVQTRSRFVDWSGRPRSSTRA